MNEKNKLQHYFQRRMEEIRQMEGGKRPVASLFDYGEGARWQFQCPNCGSRVEGYINDLEDDVQHGHIYCPDCDWRFIIETGGYIFRDR